MSDSGYRYLPAFNLENFLTVNFPNTENRCYANSVNQLLRMITDMYNTIEPYSGTEPVRTYELVQFLHPRLRITNSQIFRATYRTIIESQLRSCSIEPGMQDQNDFFNSMLLDERFKEAIMPHIGFNKYYNNTITFNESCIGSGKSQVQADDEPFLTVNIGDFPDKTPIANIFKRYNATNIIYESIIEDMKTKPNCRSEVAHFEPLLNELSKTNKLIDAASDIKKAFQFAKDNTIGFNLRDISKIDVQQVRNIFAASRDKYASEGALSNTTTLGTYQPFIEENRDAIEILKSDVLIQKYQEEIKKILPSLRVKGNQLEDILRKTMSTELQFNKLSKYFLIYISYFSGGQQLSQNRFTNILQQIALKTGQIIRIYNPISIVVHRGLDVNSGHYYTYNYIAKEKQWYLFDDLTYPGIPTFVTTEAINADLIENKPTFILYRDFRNMSGGVRGRTRRNRK